MTRSPCRISPDMSNRWTRQDCLYLLLHGALTPWEREFCKDISKVWEPSEKQLYWLQKIAAKYLWRNET